MLGYAEKLTAEPGEVGEEDAARLRDAGLGDEGLLHLVEVVAYFNFVNRLADGLGVRLEERWPHPTIRTTDPAGPSGPERGGGRGAP